MGVTCCSECELSGSADYKYKIKRDSYNANNSDEVLSISKTDSFIKDEPNGMKMYTITIHDDDDFYMSASSSPSPKHSFVRASHHRSLSAGTKAVQRKQLLLHAATAVVVCMRGNKTK